MKCEFCKNEFSTKPNLVHHQKTARYCLKLRNNNQDKKSYLCKFCKKEYTSNFRLSAHLVKCLEDSHELIQLREELKIVKNDNKYLIKHIEDNQKTIKELQDKLENVAIKAVQRPTTKNTQINNYIQNMKYVTHEHLIDSVPNLTIDHIKKGPEGYAEYALEYPFKDRMVCSDYARRKVKFKDNEGKVITDPEMSVLAVKFFESIKEKNKELICRYANELKERLGDDNVMDTVVKLFDYKSAVENGSDGGDKTDFHHDFVRKMCSQTVKE
jgi:hypothetical protein